MKTLYLSTHTTSDYGKTPLFAKIEVTPELMAKITKAQEVLSENEYDETRLQWPIEWAENSDIRMGISGLVVSRGGFWFEAWVHYQSGRVETTIASPEMLREILDQDTGPWHLNGHADMDDEEFIEACEELEAE